MRCLFWREQEQKFPSFDLQFEEVFFSGLKFRPLTSAEFQQLGKVGTKLIKKNGDAVETIFERKKYPLFAFTFKLNCWPADFLSLLHNSIRDSLDINFVGRLDANL
jgi:hypothetical protein